MPDRRTPIQIREDLLPPAPVESRTPRPKAPPEERARAIESIARVMDRRRLSFEIQQTCGAIVLTAQQEEAFSALREMAGRHAKKPPADLRRWLTPAAAERAAAYASLLSRLPCTHCAARDVCPAAHARRVN